MCRPITWLWNQLSETNTSQKGLVETMIFNKQITVDYGTKHLFPQSNTETNKNIGIHVCWHFKRTFQRTYSQGENTHDHKTFALNWKSRSYTFYWVLLWLFSLLCRLAQKNASLFSQQFLCKSLNKLSNGILGFKGK